MHHVINVMVNVVLLTELVCEGQAGEMLQPVPVNGINIKPNNERCKKTDVEQQRDADEDAFFVRVKGPKGDIGQEGEREQQATEETKDVGDVVDPGQEATKEQEEDDGHQL